MRKEQREARRTDEGSQEGGKEVSAATDPSLLCLIGAATVSVCNGTAECRRCVVRMVGGSSSWQVQVEVVVTVGVGGRGGSTSANQSSVTAGMPDKMTQPGSYGRLPAAAHFHHRKSTIWGYHAHSHIKDFSRTSKALFV